MNRFTQLKDHLKQSITHGMTSFNALQPTDRRFILRLLAVLLFALIGGRLFHLFHFYYTSIIGFVLFLFFVFMVNLLLEPLLCRLVDFLDDRYVLSLFFLKLIFVCLDFTLTASSISLIDYCIPSITASPLAVITVACLTALTSVHRHHFF